MADWQGKVAVVTGAGSGIGRAMSEQLAQRGCDVALVDISQDGLQQTLQRLSPYGGCYSTHIADVTDKLAMQALPGHVVDRHGRVDLLFNNAGITIEKEFDNHSIEDWELMLGINFWGVVYGCKFFLPYLEKSAERFGEAHIVNTSSLAGFMGIPTQASYCSTKAAVKALSESLYAELKCKNIHVTSVHPGAIKTNIFATALTRSDNPEEAQKLFNLVEKVAMQPDRAAAKIVRAVADKKARIVLGLDAWGVELGKRLLPVTIHKLFAWGFKKREQHRIKAQRAS